ncbi:MAG: hypothetical protein HYX87_05315 [Chloroflexi bacterium]|nr:hypothetical protein [Chloroflexota bacterium]
MSKLRKEDILAQCLVDIRAGKSTLEECLQQHPEYAEELKSLLQLAVGLQSTRPARPSEEFKRRARARLVETMRAAREETKLAPLERLGVPSWTRRLAMPAAAAFIALMVVVAAGGGTIYAAGSSLPGDALYPVKTGVEGVRLALTKDAASRADLRLEIAAQRVQEADEQSRRGRSVNVRALAQASKHMDEAISEAGKLTPEKAKPVLTHLSMVTLEQQVRLAKDLEDAPEADKDALQQALDAARRGNLIAEVAYGNPAVLSTSPSVEDEGLESSHFKVTGTLSSVEGGSWRIGNVVIKDVDSPRNIPAGTRIAVEGLVRDGKAFISRAEVDESKPDAGQGRDDVEVEGVFGGTSPDNKTWTVGGVQVSGPSGVEPPRGDEKKVIKGKAHSGGFTVTQKEESDQDKQAVMKGVLVRVDVPAGMIELNVAGAARKLNVSQANIVDEDGLPLTVGQLESLSGKGVKVEASGVYSSGNVWYARQARVDVETGSLKAKDIGKKHSGGN